MYNCKVKDLPEIVAAKYADKEVKGCYIHPRTDNITITLLNGEKHYWVYKDKWVRVPKH